VSHATLHPDDLQQRIDRGDDVHIVDVRSPAEYLSTHIPSSHNLPLDRLPEVRDELGRADAPLVLVCRSGQRATQAADQLAAHVGELSVLDGGLEAWDDGHRPVRQGGTTWSLERQVRLVAGSIVASSIALSAVAPRAKWVAGAVGGGLTFAALTDTCAMGVALSKLPHNRRGEQDPGRTVRELTAG
jgi:rhodanese-related sulfurtransferase